MRDKYLDVFFEEKTKVALKYNYTKLPRRWWSKFGGITTKNKEFKRIKEEVYNRLFLKKKSLK